MKKLLVVAFVLMMVGTSIGPVTAWGGGDGCTPGFWKNHPEDWPVSTSATFDSVGLSVPDAYKGVTLMEALRYRGGRGEEGAEQILLRATAAAVLNIKKFYPNESLSDVNGELAIAFAYQRDEKLWLAEKYDRLNNSSCPL